MTAAISCERSAVVPAGPVGAGADPGDDGKVVGLLQHRCEEGVPARIAERGGLLHRLEEHGLQPTDHGLRLIGRCRRTGIDSKGACQQQRQDRSPRHPRDPPKVAALCTIVLIPASAARARSRDLTNRCRADASRQRGDALAAAPQCPGARPVVGGDGARRVVHGHACGGEYRHDRDAGAETFPSGGICRRSRAPFPS